MAETPLWHTFVQGVVAATSVAGAAWLFGGRAKQKAEENKGKDDSAARIAEVAVGGFKDIASEWRTVVKEISALRTEVGALHEKVNGLEAQIAQKDARIAELEKHNTAIARIAIRLKMDNQSKDNVIDSLSYMMGPYSELVDIPGVMIKIKQTIDTYLLHTSKDDRKKTYAELDEVGVEASLLSAEVHYAMRVLGSEPWDSRKNDEHGNTDSAGAG